MPIEPNLSLQFIPQASVLSEATLVEADSARLGPRSSWRGRYVILRLHARGGLGTISLALDEMLGRKVALKQMLPELADVPQFRNRFIHEAEITGLLEHPAIVPIYALGQDEQGRPYYAMKFVEGRTLDEAIAEHHKRPTSTSLRDLLHRFVSICNAIAYAHGQGIVHRDLKPTNVMIGRFAETVIIDWGLATRVAQPRALQNGNGTGKPVGTPAYMSPEQASGEANVEPAADVYGLGALLFQILCGRAPFVGSGAQDVITQVLAGPAPAPSNVRQVSRALEAICLKAMHRDPDSRFTATELAREVERWLSDDPLICYRGTLLDRLSRATRRHRAATMSVVAGMFVIGIALAIGTAIISVEKDAKQAALVRETEQRHLAETRASVMQRRLYAANMRDAITAWKSGDGARALALLNSHLPKPDQPDLRGFEWHYLKHQMCERQVEGFEVPGGACGPIAFSPDGKILAGASTDGKVILWDFQTRRLLHTLDVQLGSVQSLSFSPDGQTIATSGDDGMIVLWSAATRERRLRIKAHAQHTYDVVFSPDGSLLASCGADNTLRLWRSDSGDLVGVKTDPDQELHWKALAFFPDGLQIVAGDSHGGVRTYSVPDLARELTLTTSPQPIEALAVAPDSRQIAVGSAWEATVIDASTGARIISHEHTGGVTGVAYDRDGHRLAAGSAGGQIHVWDRQSGKPLLISAAPGTVRRSVFSPDGRFLASSLRGSSLVISDLSAEPATEVLGDPAHPITRVILNQDGSRAFTATSTNRLQLWDTANARVIAERDVDASITAIDLSADGYTLATGDARGTVTICNATTLQPRCKLSSDEEGVRTISISPDGSLVAAARLDQTVTLWELASRAELKTLPSAGSIVEFAPDGKRFATGSVGLPVQVWRLADFAIVATTAPEVTEWLSITYSSDGSTIALGTTGGNALLWDMLATGVAPVRLQTERFSVGAVGFLSRDNNLVTANPYGSIQFWDTSVGEECGTFEAQLLSKTAMHVCADKSTIATISENGRLRLWRRSMNQRQ